MPDRLIFHIDVNSAFLSWESVYRLDVLHEELDLRNIPSAIGGDASQRHGIILAKSTSAKKYGITTGEPLVQAYKKCPKLLVVPSRFSIYHQYSHAMMDIFQHYSGDIEKFSIDEAFLDMTHTIHLFGTPMDTANQIREEIFHKLHFTVNIGVAPNKLLAKMASDFQKPDLCHSLFLNEIQDKMWPLPISELFFVGRSAQKKLALLGVKTIGDLANTSIHILKSHLGSKYAQLVHNYANGVDDDPVAEKDAINKGYGNSITLSRDVVDFETACQVLLSLSETVAARLRHDKVKCNCICVEVKDYDFNQQSHQTTLLNPTDITSVIYDNSCILLKEFWNHVPLRLIGIRTSKIIEEDYTQLNLFSTVKNEKLEKLDSAIDNIRNRYGTDSVKRASFLNSNSICKHSANSEKHNY